MPLAVFPSVSPQRGKRAEVTQRPKLPKSSSYSREAGRDGGAEDPTRKEKASPVAPQHRGIIFSTFMSGCRVFKTKALPSGISSLSPLQSGLHEIKGQLDVLVSPFWARPHMARGGNLVPELLQCSRSHCLHQLSNQPTPHPNLPAGLKLVPEYLLTTRAASSQLGTTYFCLLHAATLAQSQVHPCWILPSLTPIPGVGSTHPAPGATWEFTQTQLPQMLAHSGAQGPGYALGLSEARAGVSGRHAARNRLVATQPLDALPWVRRARGSQTNQY